MNKEISEYHLMNKEEPPTKHILTEFRTYLNTRIINNIPESITEIPNNQPQSITNFIKFIITYATYACILYTTR